MASSGGGGDGLSGNGATGFEHVWDEEGLWSSRWAGTRPSDLTQTSLGFPVKEDCEDYTTGLVEQMAEAMLDESEEQDCSPFSKPAQTLSTSPQSTLVGLSWDVLSHGGSSSGDLSSGISSPPTPVEAAAATSASSYVERDALDLLYVELLRLKMEDEIQAREQQLMQLKQQQEYERLLWEIRKQQGASMLELSEGHGAGHGRVHFAKPHNASTPGYYVQDRPRNEEHGQIHEHKFENGQNAAWSSDRVSQCYHSATTRHKSGGVGGSTYSRGQKNRGLYNHNRHSAGVNGSGMRAVFLGTPGTRESRGTGVFLPRPHCGGGSSAGMSRKPACSTVLLPSHMVQALNLNVETFSCPAMSSSPLNARRDHNGARFHHSSTTPDSAEPLPNKGLQEVTLDVLEWTC